MKNREDKALEAFIQTARESSSEIPEDVLLEIYQIEKNYQYRDELDRGVAIREIEKVLDKYIGSF
jgi:hypothetical protein